MEQKENESGDKKQLGHWIWGGENDEVGQTLQFPKRRTSLVNDSMSGRTDGLAQSAF